MGNILSDLRFAFRQLRKTPGFTAATVLTLALGIGANSAIFSVINAVLLQPYPFDPGGRLVVVNTRDAQGRPNFVSAPDFEDWRAQTRSFEDIACWVPQSVNLTGTDEPTRVIGAFVSANFLRVVGVAPAIGRSFQEGEDKPGVARVAVVTHSVWQGRFAGDPAFLGRTLHLNGEPFTVVGILPKDFHFPYSDSDVYLPLPYYPNYSRHRANTSCGAIARLKSGVSLETAQAEMTTITSALAAQYPDTNKNRGAQIVDFRELVTRDLRPIVLSLAGAVAFVLLIGCANVANLILTRMVSRGRESAVRAALGASRGRLISQLMTETIVLALAGGALGLLLGLWAVAGLTVAGSRYLPDGIVLTLDRAVVMFTLGLSLFVALVVALLPAVQMFRADWGLALRAGRGAGASAGRNRTRAILVVAEVAAALVLLVGSGLMLRSFVALNQVEPGYDSSNLLTMEYRLPRNKYPNGEQQTAFHREIVERVRALPGVVAAASVRALPFSGNGGMGPFFPAGRPEPPAAEMPRSLINFTDSNWFDAMRIPILRGRAINGRDQPGAPMVVVVNQTAARRFWPNQDPIGQTIRFPAANVTAEIVGVVGDIKHFRLEDQEMPQIYGPIAQNPFIFSTLVVRTAGDPMALANDVRRAVWSVDTDQPVWKVRSLDSMIETSVSPRRFVMILLTGYAGIALLLAAIGIFGVISYSVGQRTAEIGVRVALGAEPRHVLTMILRQGLLMTTAGIVIGGVAAIGLTRFLRTQLFAVKNTDPLVYIGVAAVLAIVAMAACVIPARRALNVDPTIALRYE